MYCLIFLLINNLSFDETPTKYTTKDTEITHMPPVHKKRKNPDGIDKCTIIGTMLATTTTRPTFHRTFIQ